LNDPKYQLPLTTDRVENPNFNVAINQDPFLCSRSSGSGSICHDYFLEKIIDKQPLILNT